MTVYIDDMHESEMGSFGRMKMSHMIADTPEELHAFAARLGMRRSWAQHEEHPERLHYDVAKGKRALAIQLGAVPIPMRALACMVALRRPRHHGLRTLAARYARSIRQLPSRHGRTSCWHDAGP